MWDEIYGDFNEYDMEEEEARIAEYRADGWTEEQIEEAIAKEFSESRYESRFQEWYF